MIISLRPLKLLVPLLLIIGGEQACWEFFTDKADDPLVLKYQLLVLVLGLGLALWYWRRLPPLARGGLLLTAATVGWLMLEAYATYGTWLIYLHVFSKVLVLFLMYGTCGFYLRRGLPPLRVFMGLLLLVLVLHLVVVHPEALSLHAFLNHERGFSADSALLLVPPTVLSLNWYLQRGSLWQLGQFFVGLGLIVFLQHRSVWLTALLTLVVDLGLVWWRVPAARLSARRLGPLVLLPLLAGTLGGAAVVLDNPAIVQKFAANFEDIAKADQQGTGSWRLKQLQAYEGLVAQRPLLGWRLEGFEVPMQFYDPSSDAPMWPDGTGHHFHSLYLDRTFYFGWVGVLLLVFVPIGQVVRRLAHPAPLTPEAAALTALLAGCLLFGVSYDWPASVYALLGLLLVYLAPPARPPAPVLPTAASAPQARPELQLTD